jgi:23S rRNA pseudouridine955/2504/2580 synthase
LKVSHLTIDESAENQRLDNYLTTQLKGVPSSRIYRAIRKGEVRVNQKRVAAEYRLRVGDVVRIPPVRVAEREEKPQPPAKILERLQQSILIETDDLLIINKPSGLPVHGGSGINTGLIEALRVLRPKAKLLELVHRLDKDTSGCLMIAKKRRMLVGLHQLLTHKQVHKQYLALVKGQWQGGECWVDQPLKKNVLRSGERMVSVNEAGKEAMTRFRPLKVFQHSTLVEAQPLTGRTHQIRVHAAHLGHPLAGDEKYGDIEFNKTMRALGLKRLFLHSAGIYCRLPEDKTVIGVCALLDDDLKNCLARL